MNRANSKIDLTLHIKNFGPVSNAIISLKPLTIFIGPNNSGKSYAAMLVHSIVSACAQPTLDPSAVDRPTSIPIHALHEFHAIRERIKNIELNKSETVVPELLVNEMMELWLDIVFNYQLPDQISHNFTSELKDLVRITDTSFNISLLNSNQICLCYENDQWSISNLPTQKFKVIINTKDEMHTPVSIASSPDGDMVCTLDAQLPDVTKSFFLSEELYHGIADKIRHGIPLQSYYLPAARSGILQGHRAISASIVSNASYAAIRGAQVPPLSGVVANFISKIIDMPQRAGEFFALAKDLENDIIKGQIRRFGDKYQIPEIKYIFLDNEIPLHRTSSTVSEMAPLILYLKHVVHKGSLLIIEEPEAHLHPANQIVLARHIAKLIRSGLNILITTHSQFLLEQLSLLLQAGGANPETRKDMGLGSDEFLREDEVAPYLFSQITPGNHIVRPLECSSADGISQEEFVRIQDELYNQTIRVEREYS